MQVPEFNFQIGLPRPEPGRLRAPSHEKISTSQIVDIPLLKHRLKSFRKDQLRKIRIKDLYLAQDALDWLAFEWRLDENLIGLRERVLHGTYNTEEPEIIRGAKSRGLTRPLAFPSLIDSLLYRNIVALAETDLMSEMQDWSKAGRIYSKQEDSNSSDSGWFRDWLRRKSQIWVMTERYDWIAETDVSNFFPNVTVSDALEHLLSHSRIGVEVARVLRHMLERFSPTHNYRTSASIGLPQDSFDASRVIAHSFLGEVDLEFTKEGLENRFSRYMDDITLGARTEQEGQRLVGRAQAALEKIGLYPNSSKTRIITRDKYAHDYMKEENDYLGDIDETLRAGGLVDLVEFEQHLHRHLRLRNKPPGWERVTRRYYTTSRQLRSTALREKAFDHLIQIPGSSRFILDYLSTFAMTSTDLRLLRKTWPRISEQYEDIRILCLEYLAVAPNGGDPRLEKAVTRFALDTLDASRVRFDRLAATSSLVVGKFGRLDDIEFIVKEGMAADSGLLLRQQLLPLALGAGIISHSDLVSSALSAASPAHCEFLIALKDCESKAFRMALARAAPRERRSPQIWVIPNRPMFLVPYLAKIHGLSVNKARQQWRKSLNKTTIGLHDSRGDEWVGALPDFLGESQWGE